jgi:transcriptional regulator with XRE-family HTH domain
MSGRDLRRIRKNTPGMTLEKLAEAMGISVSQLSRIERGLRRPRVDEVKLAAGALSVSVTDIYPEFSDMEASEDEEATKIHDGQPISSRTIPIRGFTQAGQWNEFEHWEDEWHGEVSIPQVPGVWPGLSQFAYLVKGNSMDALRIFDSEYVVCVPYFEAREDLRAGDIVVVERVRNSAIERTVKQIEIQGKMIKFCPRSTDPKFKPIVVRIESDMKEAEDTEVRVIGLVIGRWGMF